MEVELSRCDGDVAQVGGQDGKHGVDVSAFLIPFEEGSGGAGVAQIMEPGCLRSVHADPFLLEECVEGL